MLGENGCLGMKRDVWGRKRVFMGSNCMFCFFTFVCYLHVNRKLNNMLHYRIITRLW